jgi:outer membrane PBP1 activator LpoA protein
LNISDITNTSDIILYNETKTSPVMKACIEMAKLSPEETMEVVKTALEALKHYHMETYQTQDDADPIWMLDAMRIQVAQDALDLIEF